MIQEKTIKAILITESSDDEAFFNRAMDVVKKVIRTQKTDDVDTVSGATYSSKGLLNAIKNALKQAEKVTNGESIDEKPDLTELKELIEKAEKLEEDTYTETSWTVPVSYTHLDVYKRQGQPNDSRHNDWTILSG